MREPFTCGKHAEHASFLAIKKLRDVQWQPWAVSAMGFLSPATKVLCFNEGIRKLYALRAPTVVSKLGVHKGPPVMSRSYWQRMKPTIDGWSIYNTWWFSIASPLVQYASIQNRGWNKKMIKVEPPKSPWIGSRENLQETMVVFTWNMWGFSCIFFLKAIHWKSQVFHTSHPFKNHHTVPVLNSYHLV